MNFFGHAAIARLSRADPAFVFGAMLPDFSSMLSARVREVGSESLARGIAFHHETDRVFHDCRTFRDLNQRAFRALIHLGLRRGSARAVAHVGIELLIDGVLSREDGACDAFERALVEAAPDRVGAQIAWHDQGAAARFEVLRQRLLTMYTLPHELTAGALAARLSRALGSRPRLALDPEAEALVARWAALAKSDVEHFAADLSADLRSGLVLAG